MKIYYIGGSPCSGKSTIAQELAVKYGLHYFKVDDHLEKYMKMGAADGKPCCANVEKMNSDQIWMRDAIVQCDEELKIYEEIFEYVQMDLQNADCKKNMITEGAAHLPGLVKRLHIPVDRYLSITPTKAFQVFHYSKREWVPFVLSECSDQTKAFENWMERDALFAKEVQRQCAEAGYVSVINDGKVPVEEMIEMVAAHFGLK